MNSRLKEAIDFFKNNKKYHRILMGMAEKYQGRGTLGGSIEIKDLTEEERILLCKIDTKYIHAKDAKFTIKKFLKTFENTWIGEVDFLDVLEGYLGRALKTNKEKNENKEFKREMYFKEIMADFIGTRACHWLQEALESKKYGYILMLKEYESRPKELSRILVEAMQAINSLKENSKDHTRLAIFASNLTKDPHFFDMDKLGGKLLLNGIAFQSEGKSFENAKEISELLYSFGILKDEISNFTTVSSIRAYRDDGLHQGVSGFYEYNEPVQLNLWNLAKIKEIECNYKKIFVFENPAVFSEVLERTEGLNPSLLCTSGQLKTASLVLLDKLANNTEKIYYSGDFDPEGIKIAYRLKQRYGDKLVLWRYNMKEYEKIKSQVSFDERRWNQINNIEEPELKELIQYMERDKLCGYQELLVEEYLEDIIKLVNKRG